MSVLCPVTFLCQVVNGSEQDVLNTRLGRRD